MARVGEPPVVAPHPDRLAIRSRQLRLRQSVWPPWIASKEIHDPPDLADRLAVLIHQRGRSMIHRQAVRPLAKPEVGRTALGIDHENSLAFLCSGGCQDRTEAFPARSVGELAALLQLFIAVPGHLLEGCCVAGLDRQLGQIKNRSDGDLDGNQVAWLLQAVPDEMLAILREGACRSESGVEAAVLALAVPAPGCLEDEPEVEGVGTPGNVPPDATGKGQMKAPDSNAARIPTISLILPLRMCEMGV